MNQKRWRADHETRRSFSLTRCVIFHVALFAWWLPSLAVAGAGELGLGIDVSHFSGSVDWESVKNAGYAFVYVKATEGEDALDPKFTEHWQGTAALELPRGAYHFFVTEDDGLKQADFFISTVPSDDLGDLIPVVDVESLGHSTESAWTDQLKIFLARLENHFGVKPMIYTGSNFWNANVGDPADFSAYPLWIAQYEVDEPEIPNGWTDWQLWQYAGDQTVPGVESGADVDRLQEGVDLETLRMPEASSPEASEVEIPEVQDPEAEGGESKGDSAESPGN